VVDASESGLPAFERLLERFPPVLARFEPFLRNLNPMLDYLGDHRREVTAFFANVTAASLARDVNLPGSLEPVHYLRTAQTLSPEALAFYPRPAGASRQNAYQAPGAHDRIGAGLPVLEARPCANPDPAPPTSAIPETLVPLIQAFAYRSGGGPVARPPCQAAGAFPGFDTTFPRLRAEP
jgi:phospholipid/cholesterol/gamma-HCH transport system substrate-binding protein